MKISIGRFFLIGFLSLCIQSLSAQIQLLFETDQPYNFLVGLDGFVQNPEPVDKIVITGVDTGLHKINFIALGPNDTLFFNKEVRLLEKDKQRYFLTKDFSNTPRLQYRGIVERYPDKAIRTRKQKVLEWSTFTETRFEQKTEKVTPRKDSIAAAMLPALAAVTQIETPQDVPTVEAPMLESAATKDSTIKKGELVKQTVKMERGETTLNPVLKSIREQSFEFEKLQMALDFVQNEQYTLEDVQTIASLLRFDDSRLQLALQAQEKLPAEKKGQLSEIFDFEYSRTIYLNSLK